MLCHYFAHQEISLRLWDVIKDISPYLVITVVWVFVAHLLTSGIENLYLCFTVKVLFVGVAYCLTLWLLRSTIFRESIDYFIHRRAFTDDSSTSDQP